MPVWRFAQILAPKFYSPFRSKTALFSPFLWKLVANLVAKSLENAYFYSKTPLKSATKHFQNGTENPPLNSSFLHPKNPEKPRYINKKATSRKTDGFGPSGESRTHGLLNPIQARYQTALHPEIVAVSLSDKIDYIKQKNVCQQFFSFFSKLCVGVTMMCNKLGK